MRLFPKTTKIRIKIHLKALNTMFILCPEICLLLSENIWYYLLSKTKIREMGGQKIFEKYTRPMKSLKILLL